MDFGFGFALVDFAFQWSWILCCWERVGFTL